MAASSSYFQIAFANFMVMEWIQDVQSYLDLVLQGGIPEEDRPKQCPHCGQKDQLLHRHGTYPRKVFTLEKEWTIPVFRFYCPLPTCKKTVCIIPSFIQKHQQVALDIQEEIIQSQDEGESLAALSKKTGSLPGGSYSEKTLWRWTKGWKVRLDGFEGKVWEWILVRFPHLSLLEGQTFSKWKWFFKLWEQIQKRQTEFKNVPFLHWFHRFSRS